MFWEIFGPQTDESEGDFEYYMYVTRNFVIRTDHLLLLR
jgi:hypothetical protein